MDWSLFFAVLLYLTCALLLLAEVFVPSGGLISLCAFGCAAAGVWLFFQHSIAAGWIGMAVAAILIPTVLAIAYKLFPKTRFGRIMILSKPNRPAGDAIPDTDELKDMLGAVGVVQTPLRPVGTCDFSGRRLECVAESGYVEREKKVEVIRVEGTQLTVRVVEEDK